MKSWIKRVGWIATLALLVLFIVRVFDPGTSSQDKTAIAPRIEAPTDGESEQQSPHPIAAKATAIEEKVRSSPFSPAPERERGGNSLSRLASSGRIAVSVEPPAEGLSVVLRSFDGGGDYYADRMTDSHGQCEFDCIPIGVALRASATAPSSTHEHRSQTLAPLTTEEQSRKVTVLLGERHAYVVGRVIDESGEGLDLTQVRIRMLDRDQENSNSWVDGREQRIEDGSVFDVIPKEQGGFRFEGMDLALDANGFRSEFGAEGEQQGGPTVTALSFSMNSNTKENPPLYARISLPPLHRGRVDLGDVVMRVPPIFLEGRVVDEQGEPISCRIELRERDEYGYWIRALSEVSRNSRASSRQDGSFLFYGPRLSPPYAVLAMSTGKSQRGGQRVVAGADGVVELVLEDARIDRAQAGHLQGIVRLPEGSGRPRLHLHVERTDRDPDAKSTRDLAFRPPSFDAGSLPAGVYRLSIGPSPLSEPWTTLEDVIVDIGEHTTVGPVDMTHLRLVILRFSGRVPKTIEWKRADGSWTAFGWWQRSKNGRALTTDQDRISVRITRGEEEALIFDVPATGEPFPIDLD